MIVAVMIQLLHIGEPDIERYVLETFLHMGESSKESLADALIKYEQTCNVGNGELSFWHWVCETTRLLMQAVT